MLKPIAHLKQESDGLSVTVVWEGAVLDRPSVHGFGLGLKHKALADRLIRAVNAGVVYADAKIMTDIYGQTYVSARCLVLGRTLNADLKRLGF